MIVLKESLRTKSVDVEDSDLLMVKLGTSGYAFSNNEEGAIEVIIPNNLVVDIGMEKYKQCVLKRHIVQSCELI